LSDYPVLKRWEIATKESAVGRRHKDINTDGLTRRSFWEAKPQFTLHELQADEDPEKIYTDLHYSRNMLEDFDEGYEENKNIVSSVVKSKKSDVESLPTKMKNLLQDKNIMKKSKATGRTITSKDVISKSKSLTNKKEADKKRLIAVKPFLSPKHGETMKKKKRKRSRRSLDYDEDEVVETENENFQDALTEDSPRFRRSSASPLIAEYGMEEFSEDDNHQQPVYPFGSADEDTFRNRRSLPLQSSPSIANFYFDQYDNIDSPDDKEADVPEQQTELVNGVEYDDDQTRQKRSIVPTTKQTKDSHNVAINAKLKRTTHEENLVKVFNGNHNNMKVHEKNSDATKRSVTSTTVNSPKGAKVTKNIPGDTDQKKVAKALIQKAFFTTSKHAAVPKNVVRHIIPESSSSKHTIPPVEVKLLSKSLMSHDIGTIPITSVKKETVPGNSVSRQHISHPILENKQSSDSINTANVARAVAVAMEQLKRDKMWGKVFVHVRPTGELKVMVQETRKMEDNH